MLNWRKKLLLVKVEDFEGVDAGPLANVNAILATEVQFTPLQGQEAPRNLDRGFLGAQPSTLFGKYSSLQFRVEMAASGGKTIAPAWGVLHRLAGMAQTTISVAAGTIGDEAEPVGEVTGAFTFEKTTKYEGNWPRTVTLECTKAGGSGTAEFTVSAPKAGNQDAYNEVEEVMTDATPFDLGGGAQITPTINAAFGLGDKFTIELMPERISWKPVSENFESGSIYFYVDGTLHKMLASRGNVGWAVQNGISYWVYTFNGTCEPVTTQSNPVADFSAFQDPLVTEAKNTPIFRLHGQDLKIASFSGDFGNDITPRILANQENIPIADRNVTGSCVFDLKALSEKNWFEVAEMKIRDRLLFQHGVNSGQIVGIRAPNVEIRQPQYRNDRNIVQLEAGLGFIPTDAGNDEVEFWVC